MDIMLKCADLCENIFFGEILHSRKVRKIQFGENKCDTDRVSKSKLPKFGLISVTFFYLDMFFTASYKTC